MASGLQLARHPKVAGSAPAPVLPPYDWTGTQAYDGGHSNRPTYCPYDPSKLLDATDVSGIFRSSNGGLLWTASNGWITRSEERCIATCEWVPYVPALVGSAFALAGDGGAGCVATTLDYGATWTRWTKTNLFGNGNNTSNAASTTTTGTNGTDSGTITVSNAANFADAGTAYLNGILFTYSGKTGTSLTGCGSHASAAAGTSVTGGLPNPHPRRIGHLIAVDVINGYVYVGSFKGGIFRAQFSLTDPTSWNFASANWTLIGLANGAVGTGFDTTRTHFISSLVLGRKSDGTIDPDVIIVSTHTADAGSAAGRLYRITNPRAASPTMETFTHASTFEIEELAPCYDQVVCTKWEANGLYYMAAPKTAALTTALTAVGGFSSGGEKVGHVHVVHDTGTNARLAVGVAKRDTNGPRFWEGTTTDKFVTGTFKGPDFSGGQFVNDVAGPGGDGAFYDPLSGGSGKLLASQGPAGMCEPHPTDAAQYISGGRPIHVPDATAATASQHGYPWVKGLYQLSGRGVTIDPDHADSFFWHGLDLTIFRSADRGAHVTKDKPPVAPLVNDSTCGVFDPFMASPKTVYVATGDTVASGPYPTSPFLGEVFSKTDPFGRAGPAGPWVKEKNNTTNLGGSATTSDYLVIALDIVRDGGGTKYLLMAVRGDGVWYKNLSSGAFARATSTPSPNGDIFSTTSGAGMQRGFFTGNVGSAIRYAVDRKRGIWRSLNYGLSGWSRIYANTLNLEGQLDAHVDPTNDNVLIITNTTGCYRIANAGTCGPDGATLDPLDLAVATPGSLTITPDGWIVYCARFVAPSRIRRAPLGNPTAFEDVASDLASQMGWGPQEIQAGPDGTLVICLRGNCMVVGTPQ